MKIYFLFNIDDSMKLKLNFLRLFVSQRKMAKEVALNSKIKKTKITLNSKDATLTKSTSSSNSICFQNIHM